MWLAQSQHTRGTSAAINALKVGGGLAAALLTAGTGVGVAAGLGVAASGALDIANQIGQNKDKELEPPQAKGTFSTSVNITNNMHSFTLYERCVGAERARIIDDYFTMYGYKLNRVQTPNINARPAFTYIKTVGCHIRGDMCNEDTVKVEAIFDHGITFWKNGDKVADYSQNNTV
jgi:hypothetical protein